MRSKTLSLALCGAFALAIAAQAGVISVNLSEGHANQQLATGTEAGLWPRSNWNNTSGQSGTMSNLVDSAGVTNTASITWSSSNMWGDNFADTDANAGVGDAQIARGYLDDGNIGVSIEVSDITYASYYVVLLLSSDQGDALESRSATFNTTLFSPEGPARRYDNNPQQWMTNTTIIASNLTGSTLTVQVQPRNGNSRGAVGGIQIVESTEGIHPPFPDPAPPSPPVWTDNPTTGDPALQDENYNSTLAGEAIDPNDDPIEYAYVSGPTWLTVDPSGALSGIPLVGDAGFTNSFVVSATDNISGTNNAVLNIYVATQPDAPTVVLVDNATENGSFELPATGKTIISTGTVPSWDNWSEQTTTNNVSDTGVDLSTTSGTAYGLDGSYICFIEPGGAIVNMATNSPHTIQAGDVIVYSFYNAELGRDPATISLVYDDAGTNRTQIVGTEVTANAGSKGVGEFTVQEGDACIGSTLGVGLVTDGSWPEVDQVFLGVTPVPAGAVADLVISGPFANGSDGEMVLTWTGEPNGIYDVVTNSNLIISDGWKPFMTDIEGIGEITVTNDVGPDETFYRVITQ